MDIEKIDYSDARWRTTKTTALIWIDYNAIELTPLKDGGSYCSDDRWDDR
jgi:hypothetical protein